MSSAEQSGGYVPQEIHYIPTMEAKQQLLDGVSPYDVLKKLGEQAFTLGTYATLYEGLPVEENSYLEGTVEHWGDFVEDWSEKYGSAKKPPTYYSGV